MQDDYHNVLRMFFLFILVAGKGLFMSEKYKTIYDAWAVRMIGCA